MRVFHLLLPVLILVSCRKPETLGFRVTSTIPHDPQCYTQGLEFAGKRLFESGGGYGVSTIREVDPTNGRVLRRRPMARHVFAEGITILGNELFVLTWKEHTAYVLDPDTFRPIRQHRYEGEGWGLTHNGTELIMSDGSSTLRFLDPKTFATLRTITVKDGTREINQLNELEFIDGVIFANIYTRDHMARIDSKTGQVTGWLDLSPLRRQLPPPHQAEVLNGIARVPSTDRLLVTGKLWPRLFEIEVTAP
jgi:glutaminyl-peptide cyclotransferase